MPIQEIVFHAACELRFALQNIQKTNPSFLVHPWAIKITVTPKIDTQLTLRAGLTGKSSSVTTPYFNTWAVGTAPGAEYEMQGHTDGGVSYTVNSSQLINDKAYPLDCDPGSATYHALAQQLGVYDWLHRTAAAAEGGMGTLTKIDNPTYNSQVIATWDGGGSFTYNYPFGTEFFGGFGQYKIDESVAIAFTAETNPPRRRIRTFPSGPTYSSLPLGQVSSEAQQNLNFLSLQQSIVNLETAIGRRR